MLNKFKNFFSPKSKRHYEGASKAKRLSRWNTQSNSANTEIAMGLVTLRNRARDLRRNNPYASKGIQVISSNIVGHGIETQFKTENGDPKEIQKFWDAWAGSKQIDFDGRNNIYDLQKLVMEATAESGEILVRRRFDTSKKFPVQYQILESDFLDTNLSTSVNGDGNYIVQGIEFDSQGRRIAYHLFESHPGGYSSGFAPTTKSNRIPASEIFHVYRMDRPGQARGVTWLAPCIVRLKDLDDYEDAQLMRQKIAACFAAFVRDISPEIGDESNNNSDLGARIEPGIIEELPMGKTIEFATPPSVQNYGEYIKTILHGIAAGLGVTYESLTGDLSGVNFSSGRMGWLEFQRNVVTWRESILVSQFLDLVVQDFINYGTIAGRNFKGVTATHIPPKREMIDPTKEVPAAIQAIRAGLTTLSDEIAAQGKDPIDQLNQYKKDQDLVDKLGLTLSTDARQPETQGRPAGGSLDGGNP